MAEDLALSKPEPLTLNLDEQSHSLFRSNTHGFTISLVPRTFRPALSGVLTTLAALFRCIAECCTWSHAQLIDSTYILAVDRRVQEIDAAKDHGIRTLENEEFLEKMTDGNGGAHPGLPVVTSSHKPAPMSTESLKLQLIERLLRTTDEGLLQKVADLFRADASEDEDGLTHEHYNIVKERYEEYKRGEGRSYTWEEVREMVRAGEGHEA